MSIQTVTQSTVPTSQQLSAAQNTGTQAVMINLKAQGQALQGVAQSLATTHAGMAAQMAVMNDPKASKKEKADATAAYNVLAQDAVDQQGQMDDLKSVIDNIINQQLPQAQQADKAKSADQAKTSDQDKAVTDAAAEKSDQDNIEQQAQDVLAAAKSLNKLAVKSDTVGGLDSANSTLSSALTKLSKSLDAATPSSAQAGATANSSATSTSDAYTGTTGANSTMSAQATVVSDIAQGQSAEDIESYLGTQGVSDPKVNDLVKDAVKKAKDGRFAAELAQGSFDELLSSIDKAVKTSQGKAPTSKATANAGRATASVGGTSFASGTTGAAAASTGGTSVGATANAGGATANAGTSAGVPQVADAPTINTQETGAGQTNNDVLNAQPAATGTVDSMSANELLMYIMLMATGELNKEMRDMAKTMQAQTQQKATLRSQVSDAQKTYDTSVQSDGSGKASTATTNAKESLDDLNNKMDSIGDDMQQQQLRMQQIMQVQQQMMTAVSSVSKSLNDTSMSILRKIGG